MGTPTAMLPAEVDVLIAGAGPTGLTLAGLLGQRGIRTLAIDPHLDPYPLPRAVHLDDEVLRILIQLGIGEEFAKISEPAHGLRLVDRHHRTLAQFERKETGALPQANMFDQPELEQMLRRNLARLPSVSLVGGQELVSIDQSESGADVEVRDAASGAVRRVAARFVIGCDGANSIVRDIIGSRNIDLGFEQRWLVVDVRCGVPVKAWNGVYQVCDTNRAGTYMHVVRDRYRWEFQLLEGETADDYRELGALRRLIDPWVADIDDRHIQIVRCTDYTFRARVASRWRRGRVLIAGDAAHLTPPFIGQGMGAGLRDAMNLAWKLELALQMEQVDSLLDTYEAERRPHATAMVERAVMIGRVMTGGGRAASLVRRVLLPALSRVRMLGSVVLSSRSPALRPGPLVSARVPRRIRGALLPPECMAPGVAEMRDGRSGGHGFTIVVLSESHRERAASTTTARVVAVSATSSHPAERALASWLGRSRADFVVIRPDHVVLAVGNTLAEIEQHPDVRWLCSPRTVHQPS